MRDRNIKNLPGRIYMSIEEQNEIGDIDFTKIEKADIELSMVCNNMNELIYVQEQLFNQASKKAEENEKYIGSLKEILRDYKLFYKVAQDNIALIRSLLDMDRLHPESITDIINSSLDLKRAIDAIEEYE